MLQGTAACVLVVPPAGVPHTVLSCAAKLGLCIALYRELWPGLRQAPATSKYCRKPLSMPVSSTQVACEPPGNIRIRVTGDHINPNSIRMVLLDVRPLWPWQLHVLQLHSHANACPLWFAYVHTRACPCYLCVIWVQSQLHLIC